MRAASLTLPGPGALLVGLWPLLLLLLAAPAHAASMLGRPSHAALHVSTPASAVMARQGANLPTPFDNSVGNNFTTPACQTWFNAFIHNSRLLSCIPVSLLLQTSTSFFTASKSLKTLTAVLDASCSVNLAGCSAIVDDLAFQLASKTNCYQDLQAQNPLVVQAMQGLEAYKPTYRAACLKAPGDADAYCMGQAFTNRSSPASAYIYYLPLGNSLPGGSLVSCTTCLRETVDGYAQFAGNASQPLAQTFAPAAALINLNCGPQFVNTTIPTAGAVSLARPSAVLTVLLGLVVSAVLAF